MPIVENGNVHYVHSELKVRIILDKILDVKKTIYQLAFEKSIKLFSFCMAEFLRIDHFTDRNIIVNFLQVVIHLALVNTFSVKHKRKMS